MGSLYLPVDLRLNNIYTVLVTAQSHSHTLGDEHKATGPVELSADSIRPHPHAVDAHRHQAEEAAVLRLERITMFLEAQFGDVQLRMPESLAEDTQLEGEDETILVPEPAIIINLDDNAAEISLLDMVSHCI